MSIDEKNESAPFLGKRKEKNPGTHTFGLKSDQEEATGGQSKKATRSKNEGESKENEGNVPRCQICRSHGHTSYCCSWTLGIPPNVDSVPELGPNWMVVCFCGNNKLLDEVKECPECGRLARYVAQKKCCACRGRGHLDNFDTACPFFAKTGEKDPFRLSVERMLEEMGLEPKTCLVSPQTY